MTIPSKSSTAHDRPLPHNLEAERSILGAVLLDQDPGNPSLSIAAARLKPEDFFSPRNSAVPSPNAIIFRHAIAMAGEGKPVDLVTLTDYLARIRQIDNAGGPEYLAQLLDGMPRISNVEHYACIVKEKSILRELIHTTQAIQEQAFEDSDAADEVLGRAKRSLDQITSGSSSAWREMFHSYEDFEKAPPLRMGINQLVQLDAANCIGGLPEHGKTWIMLSIANALLQGGKLWGHFDVLETVPRVVYLIPESVIGPFAHRVRLFGIMPFIKADRLLVRTLSMGRKPKLTDPAIISAAKGSFVMLDTLARFNSGDENEASDFQELADSILSILSNGALGILAAHHTPKSFEKETVMTLQNMLRGTGDIGALFAVAMGVKLIDRDQTIVHVENIKARDFQRPRPFQLIGRPYINEEGDFAMHKRPGECGSLADEQPQRDKGGAPISVQKARAVNLELLKGWLAEDPKQTSEQIADRFKAKGIEISPVTVRNYKREL